MTWRRAAAVLLGALIGGAAPGGPVQAADLVIHGRIGDAFVGIDTRDDWRRDDHRRDRRTHRRGDRRFFPDHDLDKDEIKQRLERRFTFEKFYNGGFGRFPEDRRRRALEESTPRESHRKSRDRHDRRVYPGVLLPGRRYYYDDRYRYDDADRYDDGYRYDEAYRYDDGNRVRGDDRRSAAAPQREPPDARGPRFEAARQPGFVPTVGQPLPPGRPHVALDWRDYDLPEPPPGQTYVRFEGAVVLIESGTRVVREVIWPPAG